ncbi:MAG: FhaA domain-containing protein [Atopobiaceae bacterium]
MNVLDIFEKRIGAIFGADAADSAPFSFKKLAKKTVREMEDETFVIDGIDTAPALYTILVSADDDGTMRTLYPEITQEISSLVEAQAKKRGYSFVGSPLVRFMVDPSLRAGRFAIFAENVDPRTLSRLRAEENAYLGLGAKAAPEEAARPEAHTDAGAPAPAPARERRSQAAAPADGLPGADEPAEDRFFSPADVRAGDGVAAGSVAAGSVVAGVAGAAGAAAAGSAAGAGASAAADGLDVLPDSALDMVVDAPLANLDDSLADPLAHAGAGSAKSAPLASPVSDETVAQGPTDIHEVLAPSGASRPMSCKLVDQKSGRSYSVAAKRTVIGRERVPGGIVLRDPNVSRQHAEIVYDAGEWVIHDLHSTNGTLVNDIDVEACSLRDGDVITLGLMNLVFKEG